MDNKDPYEEHLEAGVTPGNLEPCPERWAKYADYPDLCKLSSRVCLCETSEPCTIYEEFLKEEDDA